MKRYLVHTGRRAAPWRRSARTAFTRVCEWLYGPPPQARTAREYARLNDGNDVSGPGPDAAYREPGPGHLHEDEGDRTRVFPRQGPPLRSPTGGAAVYPSLAAEDVSRLRAQAAEKSGSDVTTGHGPGHFHDDAPAEYILTARLGDNTFVPLSDDTIIDMRPEPRAGRPVWAPPRPAHPPWVQRILDAPIAELRRALEAPDTDAYLWNMAQRRAIEAA